MTRNDYGLKLQTSCGKVFYKGKNPTVVGDFLHVKSMIRPAQQELFLAGR